MDYGPICGLVLRRTTLPATKLELEGTPHTCLYAKFEGNQTIGGQVTANYVIEDGLHPPSYIYEETVFGLFHTLWDHIT